MKQRVIHRFAALTGGLDEDPQIGPRLGLSHEVIKHLRPQGAVPVFGQRIRTHDRIRGHGSNLQPEHS